MSALTDSAVILLRQIEKGHGRETWRAGGRVRVLAKLIAAGLVVDAAGELKLTEAGSMTIWSIDNAAARKRRMNNATRR